MCRIGVVVWVLLVIALAGLPAGLQAQGADDGLVAEWRFDEGSGSVVADSSGNGNDGVIHGATWVEGKYGKALSFDGVDDYVDIPNSGNTLDVGRSDKWTVVLWAKVSTFNNGFIFANGNGDYGNFRLNIRTMTDNKLDFYIGKHGRLNDEIFAYKINSDTWYNLAFKSDGNMIYAYVNGDFVGSTGFNNAADSSKNIYGFKMGTYFATSYWFNGVIDEVRIYNLALSEDEIKTHYGGGQAVPTVVKPLIQTPTATIITPTRIPAHTPTPVEELYTGILNASVHLHGEKTDVVLGEDVLLKLSAVNIIGNPLMRVQVIIIPPSGWSVTSSEFAKSGAGQYTTTYDIEEGVGRDIEVRIMPNQIGNDFHVQGRIIYYFGDDSDAREDHTLTLPITVRAEAENGQRAERTADTPGSEEKGSSTPGFAAVVAVAGVLAVYLRRR